MENQSERHMVKLDFYDPSGGIEVTQAHAARLDAGKRRLPELLADTGATRIPIDDGGITGPAFFDHVRRLRRPLVNSPKGQTTPVPPDLVQRPIVAPAPYWTWSLVWRRAESQPSVLAAAKALAIR